MVDAVSRWAGESKKKMAFWEHDNNPERPHLVMLNDEHANMHFDWQKVAEDPILLRNGAVALVMHLQSCGLDIQKVTRVLGVGRDTAGFAHTAAHAIFLNRSQEHLGEGCYSAHLSEPMLYERRKSGLRTSTIRAGEHVLVLLESFVPSRARMALEMVTHLQAVPAPFVGAACNLWGVEEIGSYRVGSLITRRLSRWSSAEACELCRLGSKPIKAKSREEWQSLMNV